MEVGKYYKARIDLSTTMQGQIGEEIEGKCFYSKEYKMPYLEEAGSRRGEMWFKEDLINIEELSGADLDFVKLVYELWGEK